MVSPRAAEASAFRMSDYISLIFENQALNVLPSSFAGHPCHSRSCWANIQAAGGCDACTALAPCPPEVDRAQPARPSGPGEVASLPRAAGEGVTPLAPRQWAGLCHRQEGQRTLKSLGMQGRRSGGCGERKVKGLGQHFIFFSFSLYFCVCPWCLSCRVRREDLRKKKKPPESFCA